MLFWFFGYHRIHFVWYTYDINWLVSTVIDLSIFEYLMELRESSHSNRIRIINAFVQALQRFNGEYHIGRDMERGRVDLR